MSCSQSKEIAVRDDQFEIGRRGLRSEPLRPLTETDRKILRFRRKARLWVFLYFPLGFFGIAFVGIGLNSVLIAFGSFAWMFFCVWMVARLRSPHCNVRIGYLTSSPFGRDKSCFYCGGSWEVKRGVDRDSADSQVGPNPCGSDWQSGTLRWVGSHS